MNIAIINLLLLLIIIIINFNEINLERQHGYFNASISHGSRYVAILWVHCQEKPGNDNDVMTIFAVMEMSKKFLNGIEQ